MIRKENTVSLLRVNLYLFVWAYGLLVIRPSMDSSSLFKIFR
jgi:hypothetical protein